MHEMSLVEAMVTALEDRSRAEGWGAVRAVRLRLGALRQVVPDVLTFCFSVATEGTVLAGAQLELEPVGAFLACEACGGVVPLGGRCPTCGGRGGALLSGMELEIVSVETEDPGEDPGKSGTDGPGRMG